MKTLAKCYQKDSSIVSRMIDNEMILVPIRHNVGDLESIYTLNEVGARIWELIDGERPVKKIKELILEEFEVSPEEVDKDIRDFFKQLEEIGVIKSNSQKGLTERD